MGGRLAVAAAAVVALLAPAQASAVIAETDQTATSFDGTEIRYHLFLPDGTSAEDRVPIVMQTHGWGGTGATGIDDENHFISAGYGVMTWDQRGFGASGGKVAIDSPDIEGRDVQALIDILAADARVAKRRGDPKIGMSGGSYAGGIQFVTAAIDRRIDAIAPAIAWNNLYNTLAPEGIIKLQWSLLLYGAGAATAYSENEGYEFGIHRAFAESAANGAWSHATRQFFESRGPWFLLDRIEAPTFIIQATTDTLFPPSQAVDNWEALSAAGNARRLKMAWYCGGHGVCDPFSSGPDDYVDGQIVKWFDRWVKRKRKVRTGPRFEYLDQQGDWNRARSYPPRAAKAITSEPGSGVVATPGEPTAGGVIGASATEGRTSLEVRLPSFAGRLIGEPVVNMRVTVVGSGTTDRPLSAPLFFQLVDKGTGAVLGNQTVPKLFSTDPEPQELSFPIEGVSYDVAESDQLVLEVNSNSANYMVQRGGGVFKIDEVTVDLPVVRARR